MKALHIMDGPPLYTNGFLLIGSDGHAVAVDPAAPASRFTAALEENNAKLTHILLTHGHYDHVGSVQALRKGEGAKVYIHEADARLLGVEADEYYRDMEKITVDDMEFTVIFTPGHTPGSVCIACDGLLFSGDTLFAGDIGRTDLPGGNPAHMTQSLRRLHDTITDNLQVLPGHEEFSTMDQEKKTNPYLRF